MLEEAVFKLPCCVQIGQLLETDMVPPAVMRRDVKVGGKLFALGTLILYVPDVRTLTRLGPQVGIFFAANVHVHLCPMKILACHSFRTPTFWGINEDSG